MLSYCWDGNRKEIAHILIPLEITQRHIRNSAEAYLIRHVWIKVESEERSEQLDNKTKNKVHAKV